MSSRTFKQSCTLTGCYFINTVGTWLGGRRFIAKCAGTFNIGRIRKIQLLDDPIRIPRNFRIDGYLRNAWRLIPEPGSDSEVRVAFPPRWPATWPNDWHKTQRTNLNEDGSLDFQVTVSGLQEISWWIMGYGDQAEVLEPKDWRADFSAVQKLVELYQSSSNHTPVPRRFSADCKSEVADDDPGGCYACLVSGQEGERSPTTCVTRQSRRRPHLGQLSTDVPPEGHNRFLQHSLTFVAGRCRRSYRVANRRRKTFAATAHRILHVDGSLAVRLAGKAGQRSLVQKPNSSKSALHEARCSPVFVQGKVSNKLIGHLSGAEAFVIVHARSVVIRRRRGGELVGDIGCFPAEIIVTGAAPQIIVCAIVRDDAERTAIARHAPLRQQRQQRCVVVAGIGVTQGAVFANVSDTAPGTGFVRYGAADEQIVATAAVNVVSASARDQHVIA